MGDGFTATVSEIPGWMQDEMRGRSFHDDPMCPDFAALRVLTLAHHGFLGAVQQGELVVHRDVAEETVAIFEALYTHGFAIECMQRIDAFDGDDARSMAANNSSAFNFRRIEGSALLSHHALGMAIDLNPVQNPWVRCERVDPERGRAFVARGQNVKGMIEPSGPVVQTFLSYGWFWGGHFDDMLDYHHFSKLPR